MILQGENLYDNIIRLKILRRAQNDRMDVVFTERKIILYINDMEY